MAKLQRNVIFIFVVMHVNLTYALYVFFSFFLYFFHYIYSSYVITSIFRGKFPFGDYISYSDISFTLKEIKHLWRLNGCVKKFNRRLIMRIDDFEKPAQTNVLCSNWKEWEHPIIWYGKLSVYLKLVLSMYSLYAD